MAIFEAIKDPEIAGASDNLAELAQDLQNIIKRFTV